MLPTELGVALRKLAKEKLLPVYAMKETCPMKVTKKTCLCKCDVNVATITWILTAA